VKIPVESTGRHLTCPFCGAVVEAGADSGVLPEHTTSTRPELRCAGSGWTIRGEHQ
jgi:hypothetical protein